MAATRRKRSAPIHDWGRIVDYCCPLCRFQIGRGWGGCLYIEDEQGVRVNCPHPSEDAAIRDVVRRDSRLRVGNGEWWEPDKVCEVASVVYARLGFESDCVCGDCLHVFRADFGELAKGIRLHFAVVGAGYACEAPCREWRQTFVESSTQADSEDMHRFMMDDEAERQVTQLLRKRTPNRPTRKDELQCPKCSSRDVATVRAIVGTACPKCGDGVVEAVWTGMIS